VLDNKLARPSDEHDDDDGFWGQGNNRGDYWGRSRRHQSFG